MPSTLSIIIIFLFSIFYTTNSHAILFIDTSDALLEVAPPPAQLSQTHPQFKHLKIGYKCHHFAVLSTTVRLWDCELIAMQSASSYDYYDLPEEAIHLLENNPHYALEQAKKTFWMKYGFIILFFLLFICLTFIFTKKSKPSKPMI